MKVKVKKELIKELRAKKSWTQEKFAEMSGIHSRTIQRVENEGTVSVRTLNAIAKVLDVEAYSLEFTTDKIDFGPVLLELRLLILAITRRLMPADDRELPNSLVAVLALLSFSASFTLINTLILVVDQPQQNFNSIGNLGLFGLVILFSAIYAGVVYPLFKLKNWARSLMLVICWFFFFINGFLLASHLISILNSTPIKFSLVFEYLLNFMVVFWIYRILTRNEITRLFAAKKVAEPQSSG
ncbi:helix-turn-helix domain-containing protein [Colwelliaceae bacterium 6441]